MPVRSVYAAVACTMALTVASCGGIRVKEVTYRLPGLIAGPVDCGTVKDGRKAFAEVFCATVRHMNQAGETWDACSKYIEVDGPVADVMLEQLKSARVLVVAGVFSQCLEAGGVKAFLDAKRHLEEPMQHTGIRVEHVPVSAFGSSSNNAGEIRNYVMQNPGRFIAVGYSKGAGDLMEAIARYSEVRNDVLALVTIAGSVGGSRLPDLFGPEFVEWAEGTAKKAGLPGCNVADTGGITSLSRKDRQAFLQNYPVNGVKAFSVAAVAVEDQKGTTEDERTISKALRTPWRMLQAYSLDQDSQVIADDAVVPGGTFLAIARADHWAIALPFAELRNAEERRRALGFVDKNVYPRTALLEAILRTVNP